MFIVIIEAKQVENKDIFDANYKKTKQNTKAKLLKKI